MKALTAIRVGLYQAWILAWGYLHLFIEWAKKPHAKLIGLIILFNLLLIFAIYLLCNKDAMSWYKLKI